MAYEIESFGPQSTDGIRQAGQGQPNFPPNYSAGSADLAFTTDLICDPADTDNDCDPAVGWDRGPSYGSQES
jgi:hypothetical protein